MAVKIHFSPTCEKLRQYLKRSKTKHSSIDEVCEIIGIDIQEKVKVYNCLMYVRRKFNEYYQELDSKGILIGDNNAKYIQALDAFEKSWGIFPLFFDNEAHEYITPQILPRKEQIDHKRANKHLKALVTIHTEMETFGERFITGKTPAELSGNIKLLTANMNDGGVAPVCDNCGEYVQESWVSCPYCGADRTETEKDKEE